ncbi:hypothetical protein RDI58_018517 [Solanum bulbocastanum]|uniref:Wound-responsive family protein n=1 Tax=Solanum bulbocastanum TaxID=147425 RepID=A0AAN8THG3_SOLBU
MSSTSRAWVTAVSLGVVEALKDQGVCRWNYTISAINQHAKNNLRSYSHAKKLTSQSSSLVSANKLELKKVKQSEESLRKVTRAWIVAASVGAVEALKDQVGLCRWNYPLKSLAQHTKNNMRSYSQAKKLSSSIIAKNEKAEQSEESLRKVMYLSCWGPN